MPTLAQRTAKWLGSAAKWFAANDDTPAPGPGQILYANPRIQTASGYRYNPNVLVQRKSLKVYDEMRRDGQIKAAMSLKKQFVMASGWEVVSPEGKPDDWEVTVFVADVFEDLGEQFNTSLLQMLTCLEYGFSVTEKVYDYDEDQKLTVCALNTVAPHDIQFYTDPFGNLLPNGIVQMGNKNFGQLPVDKFIIFPWQMEFGNWYGDSDLNAAHRPWLVKDQAYQWMAMLLERGGIPPAVIHYDPMKISDEIKAKLKAAVANMQAGAVMMFPRGASADSITFEWPEMAGQVSTVFIPAFDMFDKDISKSLLMPGLLGLSPDSKFGSRSNGQTHFDVFLLAIEYLRMLVAGMLQTQLIKELVDLNFIVDPDDYPQFRWKPLTDDVKLDLLTAWGTLTGQNVVLSTPEDEAYIREQMKMPPKDVAWKSVTSDPRPKDPNAPETDMGPDGKPLPKVDPKTGAIIPEPKPGGDAGGADAGMEDAGNSKLRARQPHRHYALPADANRGPTQYERKVDFIRIEKDLEGGAQDYLPRLRNTLAESRDALISQVRTEFKNDLAWATAFATLPGTDDFHTTMKAMFKDMHTAGRNSIRTEVPQRFATLPTANLDDAIAFLNAKAITVSGVTEQRILDQVKAALLQAVSTGEPLDDTIQRLRDIFGPYVDQTLDDNSDLTDPYRLEAIVRTNLTQVYNMGRMLQAKQAGDYLEGWQYSAIIDNRTTDVCRLLDGTIFDADDPRIDQLCPPRHVNCRSVVVPITTGETIDDSDLITPDEFNKAMDLSGDGF